MAPRAQRGGRAVTLSAGPPAALQIYTCEDAISQQTAHHFVIECSLQPVCHLGLNDVDEMLGITLQLLMQLIMKDGCVSLNHPAASAAASASLVGNDELALIFMMLCR